MRFLLVLLSLVLQVNISGNNINIPTENYVQKTLTSENIFSDERSDWFFRYQGMYEDAETGLYYNRFRYYDCDTGSYISQDPIGLNGGLSLYSYVHNPNYWVDVFGLDYYYQLKKNDEIIYHGITTDIDQRVSQHYGDPDRGDFDSVTYIKVEDRVASRNLEGSALHNEWQNGNTTLENAPRPVTEGYYHSYDPENLTEGRTYYTDSQIDEIMQEAETKKVENGKLCD
jgi:RHS repeat-associated protein